MNSHPKTRVISVSFATSYWKRAILLISAQAAIGLFALAISGWSAYDFGLNLIERSVHIKLDDLATEIERRAFPPGASSNRIKSLDELPSSLVLDLSTRFPDPITLLDRDGNLIQTIQPSQTVFSRFLELEPSPFVSDVPMEAGKMLRSDRVVVNLANYKKTDAAPWAGAPVYNSEGQLVGGILLQPLTNTIAHELLSFKMAYRNGVFIVVFFSIASGLALSSLLTGKTENDV